VRKSLIFSGLFHAVIIAAMFISFDLFGEPEILDEPTVFEVVLPDEVAPDAASERPPEPMELPPEPEPKEPEQAEKAPEVKTEDAQQEPQRVEEAAETPPPETVPTPEPKQEPEPPQPKPVTQDLPNVRPRDKPKPPKKFDVAALEKMLLDKRDNTRPKEDEKKTATAPDPKPAKPERDQRSPMENAKARASIAGAIASQIRQCWNAPVGATGAETLVVKLRIYLRKDGSLTREPVIVDQARVRSDDYYRVAAEAARRAVQRCAPLKLPAEYYDIWQDVTLNFDPSKSL
jgi:outer membrane biosynthesis protein TonB